MHWRAARPRDREMDVLFAEQSCGFLRDRGSLAEEQHSEVDVGDIELARQFVVSDGVDDTTPIDMNACVFEV